MDAGSIQNGVVDVAGQKVIIHNGKTAQSATIQIIGRSILVFWQMVVRVVETNNSRFLPKVPARVHRMRKAAAMAIGMAATTVGKHLSTMRLSPFSDFNVLDAAVLFRFYFRMDSHVKLAGVGFRHYQSGVLLCWLETPLF